MNGKNRKGGVRMRKIGIAILCILLCLTIAVMCVPNTLQSNPLVYSTETGCLNCHNAAYPDGTLHTIPEHSDCSACHEGTPAKFTVFTIKCTACHPAGNPGICELIALHGESTAPEADGAQCSVCHIKCEPVISTTSTTGNLTTTTTITNSCPIEEIYGEHSVEVAVLKNLRDTMLSTTPEGREIIRLYYEWSPVILMAIQNNGELKAEMGEMIDGVLGVDAGGE